MWKKFFTGSVLTIALTCFSLCLALSGQAASQSLIIQSSGRYVLPNDETLSVAAAKATAIAKKEAVSQAVGTLVKSAAQYGISLSAEDARSQVTQLLRVEEENVTREDDSAGIAFHADMKSVLPLDDVMLPRGENESAAVLFMNLSQEEISALTDGSLSLDGNAGATENAVLTSNDLPSYAPAQEEQIPSVEATTNLRSDVEDAIRESQACNARGVAHKSEGRYAEASLEYQKAIHLDPQNAAAYFNRGCLMSDLGLFRGAVRDYSRAIALHPDSPAAYNNRGYAYDEMGKYKRALRDYTKAIELAPDHLSAYNNRGVLYAKLHRYEEAAADFAQALALSPDDEGLKAKYDFAMSKLTDGRQKTKR